MFGGFNDPFFSQNNDIDRHFANIHSMMMNDFMDPFGRRQQQQRTNAIENTGSNRLNNNNNSQLMMRQNDPFGGLMSNPFSLMNSMMGNMGNIFGNMEHMMHNISSDPNAQVYSSSTVTSYTNTGNGAPKVYHASSETKQLPGGIKETRKAVRDSEKGIERMAVGHHIGNKAHIIERQRKRDGDMEENVTFENLDENEVNDFNREFEQKVSQTGRVGGLHAIDHQRPRTHHRSHHNPNYNQPLAIEDSHTRRDKKRSKQSSKHINN